MNIFLFTQNLGLSPQQKKKKHHYNGSAVKENRSLHSLGEHHAGQRHFAESFGWNSLGKSHTMRNTDICPLTLQKNKPITGITVHLLDQDYYKEAPLPKDAIRTYFLTQEIIKNTPDPTHNGTTPHEDLKVVTESTMLLKPGTTMMITSNLSPAPYVPGGLYTVKGSNLVQLTMRNTDICPLTLQKNEPITGITVHLLDEDYYEEVPISKDTLRTCFLSQEITKNTPDPTQNGDESAAKDTLPKQHLEDIQQSLQHATSLLEASVLDPPGIRGKPLQDPSPEVSRILLEQFDTKDIE